MKIPAKRVLAAAALLTAALCASAASAQRGGQTANRDGRHFYSLSELVPFEGIDVERRDGETVGMTVMRKDGSWLPLTQQTSPTCATGCPEGQRLVCWEDEEKLVSICECRGGGGFGGGGRGIDRVTLTWPDGTL